MVSVTAFYESGYTPHNIPALGGNGIPSDIERRQFSALDIVQVLFLSEIAIKATEADIAGIDFLFLEDDSGALFSGPVYYFVNPTYTMTSRDVAVLSVTMSGFLTISANGDTVEILDGMVMRDSTIPFETVMEDDMLFYRDAPQREIHAAFGAYAAAVPGAGGQNYYDPADADYKPITGGTAPARKAWGGSKVFDNIYVSNYDDSLTQSEIDAATGPVEIDKQGDKYIYTPNFNAAPLMIGKLKISPPLLVMDDGRYAGSEAGYTYPACTFYGDGSNILNTARILYSLGIANPISISYQLPRGFATITGSGVISKIVGTALSYTISAESTRLIDPGALAGGRRLIKQVYDNIANSLVKFVLTAVGTGQQSNITRRYMANPDKVIIDMAVDPGPDGAPYYKLRDKQKVISSGMQIGPNTWDEGPNYQYQTMNGAIKGSGWRPCPLVFANLGYKARESEYNARYALTQTSSANQLNQAEAQAQSANMRGYVNAGLSFGGATYSAQGANSASGHRSESYGETGGANISYGDRTGQSYSSGGSISLNPIALISGTTNAIWQNVDSHRNLNYQAAQLLNSAIAERDMFRRQNATNVYATQFAFTDGQMEMLGNGVLLEIIFPTSDDAKNAIKIVQRYGFPTNRPAENGDFIILDDADYRYIQTSGLQLAPSKFNQRKYPAMMYRLAEAELDGGIRLWRVKPNTDSYDKMYTEA